MIETDAVVVGAGPVGLWQAFQLGLLEIATHVVDALPEAGGQCSQLYPDKPIHDIPALPGCHGRDLAARLLGQLAPLGVPLHLGRTVTTLESRPDGRFALGTGTGEHFIARAVFIAAGLGAFEPRRLKVAGIEPFVGRQVLHHPRERTTLAGQRVVVFGDDDAALAEAVELAEAVSQRPARVTLVLRRDVFGASDDTVKRPAGRGIVRPQPRTIYSTAIDGARSDASMTPSGEQGRKYHALESTTPANPLPLTCQTVPARRQSFHDRTRQIVRAGRDRGQVGPALGGERRLPADTRPRTTLVQHPVAAPQRDRHAAHGARLQPHDHGRADPLPPDARLQYAVAARHRPRGHRHADRGRTPASGAGHLAPRDPRLQPGRAGALTRWSVAPLRGARQAPFKSVSRIRDAPRRIKPAAARRQQKSNEDPRWTIDGQRVVFTEVPLLDRLPNEAPRDFVRRRTEAQQLFSITPDGLDARTLQPEEGANLTRDRNQANFGLRKAVAGDDAALYKSLLLAIRDAARVPGRKVVIVFSNGPDNASMVAGRLS